MTQMAADKYPEDKAQFNKQCTITKKLIKKVNKETFESLINSLDPRADSNYSL